MPRLTFVGSHIVKMSIRFRWCLVLGLSLMASLDFAQAKDSRLKKPVTLRCKIVALRDFAKQLTIASGVTVKINPKLADLKITAICKDRPASEVMEKLAHLYQYEWLEIGGEYTLQCPRGVAAEEERFVEAEKAWERQRVEREITKWMDDAKVPRDKAQAELDKLQKEYAAAVGKPEQGKLAKRIAELTGILQNSFGYQVGTTFNQMDAPAIERFWAGYPILASSERTNIAYKIPASSPDENTKFTSLSGNLVLSDSPASTWLVLRYNPNWGGLEQASVNLDSDGRPTSGGVRGGPGTVYGVELSLRNEPLMVRMKAWTTGLNDKPKLYERRIPRDDRRSAAKSAFAQPYLSMADHLEWLSDLTGIPVVADAFRLPVSGEQFKTGPNTVGDWLLQFTGDSFPGGDTVVATKGFYAHAEGDWLLMRHGGFWRLKQSEISEELFKGIEEKSATPGLAMGEYFAFVGRLSDAQKNRLQTPQSTLSNFNLVPLAETMPALSFCSLLDALQLVAARDKDGLDYSALGPEQRTSYIEACLFGIAAKPNFLKALGAGGDGLKFFWRDPANGGTEMAVKISGGRGSSQMRPSPPGRYTRTLDIHFVFGLGEREGASYSTTFEATKWSDK